MNYKTFGVMSILLVMAMQPLCASLDSLTHLFGSDKSSEQPVVYVNVVDKQLQQLEKEKNDIQASSESSKQLLEKVSAELALLKEKIKKSNSNEQDFLQKKLSLMSQRYQLLTELGHEYQQMLNVLEQHSKLWHEYKADPDFKSFRISLKASPCFDDLQELAHCNLNYKTRLVELEKNKAVIIDDLAKRKKTLASIAEEYKEKRREHEEFSSAGRKVDATHNAFSANQRGELLDDQVRQLAIKKELAEAKVKEGEIRLALIDTQLMIARAQIVVLKDDYARIKRVLNVDENYVKNAEKALEEKRQESVEKQDRVHDKVRLLAPLKENLKTAAQKAIELYGVAATDISHIREWNKEPKTINEWLAVSTVGNIFTQEAFADAEEEYLESQIALEKAKFRYDEIGVDIIKSWYKMTQRKFSVGRDEEVDQEIKQYETPKAELQADLAALTEKRNATINLLHSLNVALDRVKALSVTLKAQKDSVFRDYRVEYDECVRLLQESEEHIRKRIDLTAKLIEVYSAIIAITSDTIKKIEDIVAELSAKSFWRRSDQSIEWSELQDFSPDLERFWQDMRIQGRTYFSRAHARAVIGAFLASIETPSALILILLHVIMLFIIFFIIRMYLPDFKKYLLLIGSQHRPLSRVSLFFGIVLSFIESHIIGIYIWLALFIAVKFELVTNAYTAILFYLISIPYLLFLVYQFINYLATINVQYNYVFISQSYQKRFLAVVSSLLYATIVIFFLREAFLLGDYPTSNVPVILLALNYILLQIALISLIGKEQILGIIRADTPLREWVKEHVSKYYYVLWIALITIIVMSNPYVGYWRQVFYILSRLFLTVLLIPIFSWLHNRIKRTSSDLFFYYADEEKLKERFTAGKTWYGVFVVASFLIFLLLAFVIGAKIWGHAISARDVSQWLNYEIYSPGLDEATGKQIQVTTLSLFKIIFFVFGGIVLTYIVNHFLLKRIFDPLLMGSGVQNTILTLTRYAIILIALLIGLQSAGLGTMTTKIAVMIGIIGFAIKEPIGDFFSYFIILVQRPIKIGDLVLIDNDVMGVVRQITPRSTIIRRKNSVTIIVPNSHVITKAVVNWNFTRTFFAFDDIFITVSYSVDPTQVKQIIIKVLDENSNVLKNPAPIVWLNDFVDNGYQFLVRGYLTADKVLEQWEIASLVRLEMVRRLREAGIEVASPTRTLKVLSQTSLLGDIPTTKQ